MMGTALATGQAAGVAAGISATAQSREEWSFVDVQSCLKQFGARLDPSVLPGPFEVDKAIYAVT